PTAQIAPHRRNQQQPNPRSTKTAKAPDTTQKPAARESLLVKFKFQTAGRGNSSGITSRLSRQRRRAYT
ncbi:hypothetical protein, partial [Dongia deserti]|uniref:hypothetical protein n=1 Tax=Dongia deserti TaxID=2268030 RepID=UPI002548E6F0